MYCGKPCDVNNHIILNLQPTETIYRWSDEKKCPIPEDVRDLRSELQQRVRFDREAENAIDKIRQIHRQFSGSLRDVSFFVPICSFQLSANFGIITRQQNVHWVLINLKMVEMLGIKIYHMLMRRQWRRCRRRWKVWLSLELAAECLCCMWPYQKLHGLPPWKVCNGVQSICWTF
jgi:hypothetical protein